ncbi:MAG: Gfo/Idh/MocA family oxidoreductase [Bacteroidetes bacterium]|nr:Gfo/Idh/MocA family oxidoreductase [Bacteroidota bacterium]
MKNTNRRSFIKTTAVAGIGIGLAGKVSGFNSKTEKGKRIGMIGLDTDHSEAFTRSLNDPLAGDKFLGYKVVAAYPKGTEEILEWKNKIPEITENVKSYGVEIVNSIDDLLTKVDVVLITCIDGNQHLEQVMPVFKAGKPVFIDKPFAAALSDAYAIANAAKKHNVPLFSSSSLRYITGAKEIAEGEIGEVIGAEAYSPAHIEEHHPDLFWYAVHGVETLFTIMGTGCKSVQRTFTEDTDVVVGVWEDDRIGTFRGIRKGKGGYGVTVYGEKGISVLNKYSGYEPLLVKICEFYESGKAPISIEETLEIFAFMQAAEESKNKGGISIEIESVVKDAKN